MLANDIAKYIDHTLLKPEATIEQIEKLCLEAREYSFASVCINPVFISRAKELLKGTDVKVCTVIGFPLGATLTDVKAFESRKAIDAGAHEIDMVINIGALKSGDYEYLEKDIKAVVETCKGRAMLKVIIETCLLTRTEIVKATEIVLASGADFVKTSTGFAGGGATIENVKLMHGIVGERIGVKAAGGVRSYRDAIAFLEAGATRLGTSAGVAIVTGQKDGTVAY